MFRSKDSRFTPQNFHQQSHVLRFATLINKHRTCIFFEFLFRPPHGSAWIELKVHVTRHCCPNDITKACEGGSNSPLVWYLCVFKWSFVAISHGNSRKKFIHANLLYTFYVRTVIPMRYQFYPESSCHRQMQVALVTCRLNRTKH